MTGYLHPGYADSLAEFGQPRSLPRSGGWILERTVPGWSCQDALGCYPLFTCASWPGLKADLEDLQGELVSLALVTDPFGDYDEAYLRRCFPDVVIAFKDHYVADLARPRSTLVSRHHRYYARKALRELSAEPIQDPARFATAWTALYAFLVERFGLRGIKAFSATAFAKQLALPGLVAFRAVCRGETVAAHLWYVQGEVAYSHLAASSPLGYELSAPYALCWKALEFFAGMPGAPVRWLDLGAGAGAAQQDESGLTFFKRGWATGTRPSFFCGSVLDPARYREIVQAKGALDDDYFPAYRRGEFG